MGDRVSEYKDLLDRLTKVEGILREAYLAKVKLAALQFGGDVDVGHEMAEAKEHCEKAEKAASEGHVMEAEKEAKLCGDHLIKAAGG